MPRRKVKHSGKGPVVRDARSGWAIGPDEPALLLPLAPDATVLRALKKGTLVYADQTAVESTKSVDDDTPEVETPDEDEGAINADDEKIDDEEAQIASDRLTLVECAKSLMDTSDERFLTKDGRPTVDALRETFLDSTEREIEIDSSLRDEIYEEALTLGDDN